MAAPPRAVGASPIALRSPARLAFFDRVFTRFARRHLNAVRLARWGRPRLPPGGPVVVFANHPSWWDGMAVMLLWRRLLAEREL